MTIKLGESNILTAFHKNAIGTRVYYSRHLEFLDEVGTAIELHERYALTEDRVEGQYFLRLPYHTREYVSSGVGKVPQPANVNNFVLREHRGQVSAFLIREFAAQPESVAVVVYTLKAYNIDPDVSQEEWLALEARGVTHVIVAVLAGPEASSPLTPYRLVHNLAGGNREALTYTADEIREKAKTSLDYWNQWHTVAD